MTKRTGNRNDASPTTRDQMVAGAADLLRRRGVSATSLRDIVRHTRTPRGSLGHHFPGGKAQLLEDAVDYARRHVSTSLSGALERRGATGGLRAFVEHWRSTLHATGYAAGCAVMPVAIEAVGGPGDDPREDARLKALANDAFQEWAGLLAAALRREGVDSARAATLGTLTVASLEGAIAMSRAARSCGPLDQVALELERVLSEALPRRGPAKPGLR